MADEETQVEEDTLWWAFDALPDLPPSLATFDEPLEWPEALPWDEPPEAWLASQAPLPAPDAGALDARWAPHPEADRNGGSAGEATELHVESLPDSIWTMDGGNGAAKPVGAAQATASPATAASFYAAADRKPPRWWRRGLDIRHGNAAMVALASFVSLVLLGMFLSVRARNNVPTDSSRTQTTSDQIVANRPLNTVPSPISVPTSLSPPSTISLSELLTPTEDGATATGGTAPAARGGTTATTAAPARSSAPTGGTGSGGGGAATQPTTATTSAPPPDPAPTTTTPTTQPVEDTTPTPVTTRPSQTTTVPDVSIPTFPTVPNNPRTSITYPSIPGWPNP